MSSELLKILHRGWGKNCFVSTMDQGWVAVKSMKAGKAKTSLLHHLEGCLPRPDGSANSFPHLYNSDNNIIHQNGLRIK